MNESNIYKINESFRIEKTKYNFTLQELKEVEARKDTNNHKKGDLFKAWQDCGHYQSLKYALKAFVYKFADHARNENELLDKFAELEKLYFELGEKK